MKYVLHAPTYRMFPYERELAVKEIRALIGLPPRWAGEALSVATSRPIPTELLRRLAFVSRFETVGFTGLTLTSRLEQSALLVRNGNSTTPSRGNSSSRKEPNYLTHGLHKYKGKFYPQLCRSLINNAGVGTKDLVLDPFAGSGTTLVECAISDIDSVGFDLNPLAHLIASTKIRLLEARQDTIARGIERFQDHLLRECRRVGLAWSGPGSPEPAGDTTFATATLAIECALPDAAAEISRWFPPAVCQKLVAVLRAARETRPPVVRALVKVCLSDHIRSVSQQDPRDLRIRRRSQEIIDAPLLSSLSNKLSYEVAKLKAGVPLIGGPVRRGAASAELYDARRLDRHSHPLLTRRQADAVITSPPYANALPYVDTDRLSLLVLGLLSSRKRRELEKHIIGNREIRTRDRQALEEEMAARGGIDSFPDALARQVRIIQSGNLLGAVGFRRRNLPALLYQYFRDMRTVMSRLHDTVRQGGRAFIVVGDSKTELGTGERVTIRTTEHIASLSEQVGWKVLDAWPISVTVEDFAHVKNAITENKILVLSRGTRRSFF